MTLQWTPTKGHTYHVYERINGTRQLLGKTTTGEFTIPNMTRGTHYYFVTVTAGTSSELPKSNEIVFVKRKR